MKRWFFTLHYSQWGPALVSKELSENKNVRSFSAREFYRACTPFSHARNFAHKALQARLLVIFLLSAGSSLYQGFGKMIEPPSFDVSGVHGAPGISGYDLGLSTGPLGQHGQRGGHGTRGQHGTSAGTISVRLTTPKSTANIPKNVVLANPMDADVKLDASLVCADGQLQKMDTVLKIKSGETMSFLALGGNGGQGGHGGNGQHGGKGFEYGAFLVLSFIEPISKYA
jgi:hypothetical protein